MLRHCVLLTFKDRITHDQISHLSSELARLRALPMVSDYRFGPDAGLAEGNADFAIIADFPDVAAYEAYAADPTHQAVLSTTIRPLISERTALQFNS
ncbi:MAG: Dabb family protein [Pseudomonadota bacterium]